MRYLYIDFETWVSKLVKLKKLTLAQYLAIDVLSDRQFVTAHLNTLRSFYAERSRALHRPPHLVAVDTGQKARG